MAKTNLFVYGTLQRGQRQNGLLAGQEFVGPARTRPRYRLHDLGRYPGLVEDEDQGVAVEGEIWRIDDETLQRLDDYEGVPHLYTRAEIALEGLPGPVQAYFYRGDVTGRPTCGTAWRPEGS